MFTNISGVSNTFDRGIICYSNASKVQLLNVDLKKLEKYGAVSEEIANQLAFNLRILSGVDIGIGITGIAGPTGGTEEKSVGLVYIGFSTEKETVVKQFQFHTDRIDFKKKVLEKILGYFET
jgi:nicotinamide-nucleotide amidase